MIEPTPAPLVTEHPVKESKTYSRFDLLQRIQHLVLLVSFTILALTGLPQKFALSPLSEALIRVYGGIETTRLIHHVAAIVLSAVGILHVIEVLYRMIVLRAPLTMVPLLEDFKHLFQDLGYYFNQRRHKAYYGRYSYGEKVEYLAVVWGTIIMAITGFIMWNPIASTNGLPGAIVPASKAAHGGEAILAVLSILIWHFYHVHLRHFNKSMFTGKFSREEMEHEHPAELAQIEAGQVAQRPPPGVLRRRQRLYFPVAGLLTVFLGFSLYRFVTYEQTAITTIPQGETVQVFVPITPTPRPTPTITPTLPPGAEVGADTWAGTYEGLFRNRCSTCHGVTAVGDMSLATYQSALKGGKSGPAIVPGDPDGSKLVQVQLTGKHPGQLTIDELNQVIAWIEAGAPEK